MRVTDPVLSKMKLLASGWQTEIYDLDGRRALRVFRRLEDEPLAKYEMGVMQSLKAAGFNVAQVYAYRMVDARPALEVEWLSGETMLARMKREVLRLGHHATALARLHCEIGAFDVDFPLNDAKSVSSYLIGRSKVLDQSLKDFVLRVLDEVPDGASLCHGDFHPGNIVESNDRMYVIDWVGATKGLFLSDIARTYLTLSGAPQPSGAPAAHRLLARALGRTVAHTYLKTVYGILKLDWAQFSKWLVVCGAERTSYGLPAEEARLVGFLRDSHRKWKEGSVHPERWYRRI